MKRLDQNETLSTQFFNKVKNKKIRWSGWPDDMYFIPERLGYTTNCYAMYGRDQMGLDIHWYIYCGFERDENGCSWHLMEEVDLTLDTSYASADTNSNNYELEAKELLNDWIEHAKHGTDYKFTPADWTLLNQYIADSLAKFHNFGSADEYQKSKKLLDALKLISEMKNQSLTKSEVEDIAFRAIREYDEK